VRLEAVNIEGVRVVDVDRQVDERGFFARTWCANVFKANGVHDQWEQSNLSHNSLRGTLRGLHFATAPAQESKLVRCVAGAVFDVVVDTRPGSPSALSWFGVELSRDNGRALYVPAGVAHGFLTLENDTDVEYLMGEAYRPNLQQGVRWNDPLIQVDWPFEPIVIGDRDRNLADLDPSALHG
jgi:dTDP-4-dehydrorhamnose 3,5-epimerase